MVQRNILDAGWNVVTCLAGPDSNRDPEGSPANTAGSRHICPFSYGKGAQDEVPRPLQNPSASVLSADSDWLYQEDNDVSFVVNIPKLHSSQSWLLNYLSPCIWQEGFSRQSPAFIFFFLLYDSDKKMRILLLSLRVTIRCPTGPFYLPLGSLLPTFSEKTKLPSWDVQCQPLTMV